MVLIQIENSGFVWNKETFVCVWLYVLFVSLLAHVCFILWLVTQYYFTNFALSNCFSFGHQELFWLALVLL